MHLNNILHFGISFLVTRIISNPVLNNKNDTANSTIYSEQIISDELWDYLTLEYNAEKLDHENDSKYSDFLPQDLESFYVNRSNFRWSRNINLYEIPYVYELDEQTFDEDYQKRVENAIELLNFQLDKCIEFR